MNVIKTVFISMLALSAFTSCRMLTEAQSKIDVKLDGANKQIEAKQTKSETPEQKAIRLAEEFIERNGYINAPADKEHISHETVEFYKDADELLKQRYNSLEPKAFGVAHHGRLGDNKGWTVVFNYKKEYLGEDYLKQFKGQEVKTGRAVTMNENFENLLVEHKVFILEKIEKKLQ